mmetsp:Transcript_52049/g.161848  ORF Transcript_52049/g.161848 Transcript_52049/m.161848 type:complete len:754 (-) Transcript_52049:10-2271(-)
MSGSPQPRHDKPSKNFHISFGSPSVDALPDLSSNRPVGRAWHASHPPSAASRKMISEENLCESPERPANSDDQPSHYHTIQLAQKEVQNTLLMDQVLSLSSQLEDQRRESKSSSDKLQQYKESIDKDLRRIYREHEAEKKALQAQLESLRRSVDQIKPSASTNRTATARKVEGRSGEKNDHLESEIFRLKGKLSDMQTKLSKNNVKCAKLETLLQQARNEHRNTIDSMVKTEAMLRNNVEDKAVLIAAMRRDAEDRMNTIEQLRENVKEAQVEKFKASQELEECKAKQSEDATELSRLRLTVQRFELKLEEQREAKSDERGERVAEIMQENSDLKEQIKSITSNYEELENAVRVLHRVQMENMSINEARANSLQVNLENEVERLQTENQALKRVNQEFEEEFSREKNLISLQTTKHTAKVLQECRESHLKEIQDLRSKHEEEARQTKMEYIHNMERMRQGYEEELADLNETIGSLMRELRAKETEVAVLTSSLNKTSDMAEKLEWHVKEVKRKEEVIARLEERTSETGEDLARVSKMLHDKEMSLTLLQEKHEQLQMECRSMRQETSKLEIELMSKEETEEELRSRVKSLQADLDETSGRASSLEMSLQLETDARLKAEKLAIEVLKQQKDKEGLETLYSNTSLLSHDSSLPVTSHKLASLYDTLAVHEKHAKYWDEMRKSLRKKIHELDNDSIASLEAADTSEALKLEGSSRPWDVSPESARGGRESQGTPDRSRQELQSLIETVDTILRRE